MDTLTYTYRNTNTCSRLHIPTLTHTHIIYMTGFQIVSVDQNHSQGIVDPELILEVNCPRRLFHHKEIRNDCGLKYFLGDTSVGSWLTRDYTKIIATKLTIPWMDHSLLAQTGQVSILSLSYSVLLCSAANRHNKDIYLLLV